jgi:DNA-binding NarL/FixJ family response regulator
MSEKTEDGSAIRVLIVDDHPLARQGLRVFLHSRKDIQVVGEAASGEEAVRSSEQLHPDIALMDMVMPGMDGAATIRGVLRASPTTRVIALTSF